MTKAVPAKGPSQGGGAFSRYVLALVLVASVAIHVLLLTGNRGSAAGSYDDDAEGAMMEAARQGRRGEALQRGEAHARRGPEDPLERAARDEDDPRTERRQEHQGWGPRRSGRGRDRDSLRKGAEEGEEARDLQRPEAQAGSTQEQRTQGEDSAEMTSAREVSAEDAGTGQGTEEDARKGQGTGDDSGKAKGTEEDAGKGKGNQVLSAGSAGAQNAEAEGKGGAGDGGADTAAPVEGSRQSHRAKPKGQRKDGAEYVPYLEMAPTETIPDKCMAAELARADKSYRANLVRRGSVMKGDKYPVSELVNKVFVPPYGCVLEQRLGKGGEGGKWVCRGFTGVVETERSPVVVSIGSRGETTFEEDVHATFRVVPDTFDPFLAPALRPKVAALDFLHYHNVGLMGSDDLASWHRKLQASRSSEDPNRMVNLTGLLRLLGKDKIDIFKIDCDGCEDSVVRDIAAAGTAGQVLRQIAVEVHSFQEHPEEVMQVLRGLEGAGYRLFHAEENAYCYRGCFELAYIHDSIVSPPEGATQLSAAEDATCFDVLARRAEAIWEANWNRKGWSMRKVEVPEYIKWQDILSIMLVSDYPCAQQERFGIWDRGGAWVCLRHRAQCPASGKRRAGKKVLVTVGGPDSLAGSTGLRFERELAEEVGAKAHIFNPFLPKDAKRTRSRDLVFHDAAVAGTRELGRRESQTKAKHMSLLDALGDLKLESVFLLRVDCGGCEFALVEDMRSQFTADTVPFGQISMAFHRHKRNMPTLRLLKELGYRQFHSEEVGYDEVTFELSFIHQSCV